VLLDTAACIGLVFFHRVLHLDLRRAHNELTGYSVAVISVTYAVLLAFIAIATWESFTNSEDIVDREADWLAASIEIHKGCRRPWVRKFARTSASMWTRSFAQSGPFSKAEEFPARDGNHCGAFTARSSRYSLVR
jgi:hypothetical protein